MSNLKKINILVKNEGSLINDIANDIPHGKTMVFRQRQGRKKIVERRILFA
jgi:hypothetical protein